MCIGETVAYSVVTAARALPHPATFASVPVSLSINYTAKGVDLTLY